MFQAAQMLYLYVESPLHAGSGRDVGAIDLPIQRERVTHYPLVQSSGLKGALRAVCDARTRKQDARVRFVFGPDTKTLKDEKDGEHAGALSLGDARLLLFPVRSLAGVFAWTTSVDALERFRRDASAIKETLSCKDAQGKTIQWPPALDGPAKDGALVTSSTALEAGDKIVLEEYAFTPDKTKSASVEAIASWLSNCALPTGSEYNYWRKKLASRLVILHEDAFRDFTQFATEVVTRVKLNDDTKTVDTGGLWTEEHLPVDTLLYAPLAATDARLPRNQTALPSGWDGKAEDVLKFAQQQLNGTRVQIGGDETVGRGTVMLRFGSVNGLGKPNGASAQGGQACLVHSRRWIKSAQPPRGSACMMKSRTR